MSWELEISQVNYCGWCPGLRPEGRGRPKAPIGDFSTASGPHKRPDPVPSSSVLAQPQPVMKPFLATIMVSLHFLMQGQKSGSRGGRSETPRWMEIPAGGPLMGEERPKHPKRFISSGRCLFTEHPRSCLPSPGGVLFQTHAGLQRRKWWVWSCGLLSPKVPQEHGHWSAGPLGYCNCEWGPKRWKDA